jgi:hypothetical protein
MSADVAQNQQETAPPELFVLRDEQGPILYAPLASLIARANESAVAAALAFAKDPGSIEGMTDDERSVVQTLGERGFFTHRAYPRHEVGFRPAQVTLFPTNNCNLRCSYCYAFGGEGGGNGEPLRRMDLRVAQRAIDLIARNALGEQIGLGRIVGKQRRSDIYKYQ